MARGHLLERGFQLGTFLCPMRTSGMEMASCRRIDRTGDLPLENDFLPFQSRVCHRDGGEKGLGVGMPGILVEDLGRSHLHDPPQVHDRDVVTDVGHDIEVVGDEEIGQPESFLQVLQQVDDLGLDGNIQGGDRLVGDDQIRD